MQPLQAQIDDLNQKLDTLQLLFTEHNHDGISAQRINLIDIFSVFPTVTDTNGSTVNLTAKTSAVPLDLYGQIFYWTDTSLKRLYWYDSTNNSSTISNGWHYITATV